jgi:hypothetical protein
MLERKQQMRQECSNEIGDQHLKEQLRLGSKRISGRQNLKNECQDIVEGSAPSKTKEETTNNSLRAMDVGVLTTL